MNFIVKKLFIKIFSCNEKRNLAQLCCNERFILGYEGQEIKTFSIVHSKSSVPKNVSSLKLCHPVYIHPGQFLFSLPLNHAQKFPFVTLIKGSVIGNKIQGMNSLFLHLPADMSQQTARNAMTAEFFLHKDSAYIGR